MFTCVALLLAMTAAPAQPALLRGVIRDPQGAAVAGAAVTANPGNLQAISNEQGEYVLSLAAGTYDLQVRAPYFEPVTANGVQVDAVSARVVDVQFVRLRPSSTQVDVIGAYAAVLEEIPGSGAIISRDLLSLQRPLDNNEILRSVPGLLVREDSGPVAMRLNLGVRGLNPDRSRQLLVLEDGIPLSLAPYGEPEMYYSPPVDRMERIEVLKGSGSILHGPQTVGGVINFVTPDPPAGEQFKLQLSGGNNGLFIGQGSWGRSYGDSGLLVHFLRKQGDGFRDFFFDINDFTIKARLAGGPTQSLGLKFNVYDERSNSTYLGLTVPQFRRNPAQNVVSGDGLKVRRFSGSLNHQAIVSPRLVVHTTAFGYNTERNWRRQDFDRAQGAGRSYTGIFGDPSLPGGAVFLRDSTGNRNREFDVWGVESRLFLDHQAFGLSGKLEAGARYLYEQAHEQRIDGATARAATGVLREDEIRTGHAVSLFAQNRFHLGRRWVVTPGVRLENFGYDRHIRRKRVAGVPTDVDIRGTDRVFQAIPGLGLNYQAADAVTLFAGIHRGFAPPRIKDALDSSGGTLQLDAELSWNSEAGARWTHRDEARAEITWFRMDFENQIIPASQSAGQASFGLVNGGRTQHQGVELTGLLDLGSILGLGTAGWFVEGNYTWLPTARFAGGFIPGVEGNRVPYAARHLAGFRVAYDRGSGWGGQLGASFVDNQFTDAANTVDPTVGPKPNYDGQTGLLPSYAVWNLTVDYTFPGDRATIVPYLSVKNLLDRSYIASRAPEGIQPGWPRQLVAGIRFRF